ncbi:hypothetical protein [Hymenobacter ruricola]|uniref:Uncharacterized protein n=1 Tax=Hymenobacter ruricola TaxID=2791023 RepID=A0ABS0I351_9BACT|nr:hypothetical protein [Hymenobacter ruricola]MBF9221381.1 hypothetical protein [Hymenobacter ruricola]
MESTSIISLISQRTGDSLSTESLQVVRDFTLLWMFYEGSVFGTHYESEKMKELVERGELSLHDLNSHWDYFQQRYLSSPRIFSAQFDQLTISQQSAKDRARLEQLLTEPTPTDADRTIAVPHDCRVAYCIPVTQ